jgi:glycosyltransferase involved in cell wall biosynthesis
MIKFWVNCDAPTSTTKLVSRCIQYFSNFDLIWTTGLKEMSTSATFLPVLYIRSSTLGLSKYSAIQRHVNSKYAYIIDDNFWLLLEDSALDLYYQHPSVRNSLETCISGAEIVYCHTENFKRFLLYYNPNVVVLPTYFDFDCLNGLQPPNITNEIRIGIVGNTSKKQDLDFLISVITDLLPKTKDNVIFEFFGYTPLELIDEPRVRSLDAIEDYEKFIAMQYSRGWLLALAPLRNTLSNQYKTNNKFREYGACAIAGIYSNVAPYTESVQHGKTGWILDYDPRAWANKIMWCLEHVDETKLVGQYAQRYVQKNYDLKVVREIWLKSLEDLAVLHRSKRISRFLTHAKYKLRVLLRGNNNLYVATCSGWENKKPIIGANDGFYDAQVVYAINPNQSISTQVLSPVSGNFRWSTRLGTFGEQPLGSMRLSINSYDGKLIAPLTYEEHELIDGGIISVLLNVTAGQIISLKLTNLTKSVIGVFSLSPRGKTVFDETNFVCHGGFFA